MLSTRPRFFGSHGTVALSLSKLLFIEGSSTSGTISSFLALYTRAERDGKYMQRLKNCIKWIQIPIYACAFHIVHCLEMFPCNNICPICPYLINVPALYKFVLCCIISSTVKGESKHLLGKIYTRVAG